LIDESSMKKCLYCNAELKRDNPRANNKKYCDTGCRTEHYRETGRLKLASDKVNHRRWNQYEEGKEQCVICRANGEEAWYWAVCHHAAHRHGVSHAEYKKLIGVDVGKGRIPPRLKKIKREHVFENGTVENLKKGKHRRYRKGDPRAGIYQRSVETMVRLKEHFKRIRK
jgi:hypothetical protein